MKEINFLGYTFGKKEQATWASLAEKAALGGSEKLEAQTKLGELKASYHGEPYQIYETIYDGEKSQGSLGAPLAYFPDYASLSFRSWQAYTESDLAQIIIKSHVNWVIGSGLRLQAEPNEDVIKASGFDFDRNSFVKTVESRYRIYTDLPNSTHSGMKSHNALQREAYLNAIVGGDVLCIDRLENGLPTKQLIDGIHVQQPHREDVEKAEARKNTVTLGVERDEKGTHIAFFVREKEGKYKRVLARGARTGQLQAYLIYGTEYRIDSVRGMPLLSAVLEKMKKLDRYNEAMVATAEEAAKIAWTIEHSQFSDGTNPDIAKAIAAMTSAAAEGTATVDMTDAIRLIKRTFEKDAINLPIGATLKRLDSGMEKDHEAFTTGNFIFICAATETPYEVALMKYVNSFSSSRMASQTWQILLLMKRAGFDPYNKSSYNLFLDSQILSGKVKADGYFSAQNSSDVILLGAYRKSRFTGPSVPQADPSKEVKAEVMKLKNHLTTHDRVIETLGNGEDFESNLDKLAQETVMINNKMPKESIEPAEPKTT